MTYLKRPWYWERLKAGGEGNNRGWDGFMASLIQWTWVWVNSGSCWWTQRPVVLHTMALQRVQHNWATELNWTELKLKLIYFNFSSILSFSEKLFVFILTIVQQVKTTPWWLFVCKIQLYSAECRRIVIYNRKVSYDEMNKQYIMLNANLTFPISTSHITCLNSV